MAKILIVEDEQEVAGKIAECLKDERHTCEHAPDGRVGIELLAIFEYDLVLLDWNMPNLSGVELCKEYRRGGGETPVIMVTGNSKIKDIVTGLDAGADDYIIKPFDKVDLLGRVRAILRRFVSSGSEKLELGGLSLDEKSMSAAFNNKPIKLRPRELCLLQFFMEHAGQHFSARELISRVWTSDGEPSMEALRQSVKRLRDAFEAVGASGLVRFDKEKGYTLANSGSDT